MRLGIVGLGRMGANLARRAIEQGHEVVGYNKDPESAAELSGEGVEVADSIEDLATRLISPRIVLIYVPHGDATESVCRELGPHLDNNDVVIDGGNSHWEDSKRRHAFFTESGIRFLDMGTSGGVEGARRGACFMAGGDESAFELVRPLLEDLAVDEGGVYFAGGAGSGHFVKLVHNAIEFGMVQAIAEGVELLDRWDEKLDMPALFNNWMHGSVIRSWLVELMGNALMEETDLEQLSTYVEDTGEVKWVVDWAVQHDVPLPVTSTAQTALMQYRDTGSVQAKAHALLRNQYGGHPVHRAGERERS